MTDKTKGQARALEIFKKQGVDVIEKPYSDGIEVIVLDDSLIKTKAQLTDIWNKANGNKTISKLAGKGDDLAVQAKKYKSADEFIDYVEDLKPEATKGLLFRGVPDTTKLDGGFSTAGGLSLADDSVYFSSSPSEAISYGLRGRGPTRYASTPNKGVIVLNTDNLKIKQLTGLDGHSMDEIKTGGFFEQAKKEGFDGAESKFHDEVVVWNTDKLNESPRTTLKDIWNKANK